MGATSTDVNPYTLNFYLGTRLLRGDEKEDIELIVENYYQKGVIDKVGRDWLRSLLNGDYEKKDFDMNL